MAFEVQTEYDSTNNIGIVRLVGSPQTEDDVNRIVEAATKTWTKSHKVYAITDLSQLDFAKLSVIDEYQKKISPISKEKVVMSVSVSSSILADRAAKMFNTMGHRSIVFAKSMEEAHEIVKSQQNSLGVFVPLDK
jgi:hypothetical protein